MFLLVLFLLGGFINGFTCVSADLLHELEVDVVALHHLVVGRRQRGGGRPRRQLGLQVPAHRGGVRRPLPQVVDPLPHHHSSSWSMLHRHTSCKHNMWWLYLHVMVVIHTGVHNDTPTPPPRLLVHAAPPCFLQTQNTWWWLYLHVMVVIHTGVHNDTPTPPPRHMVQGASPNLGWGVVVVVGGGVPPRRLHKAVPTYSRARPKKNSFRQPRTTPLPFWKFVLG